MPKSGTMIVELIKPYTNAFGRTIEPHPLLGIVKYPRPIGEKLIAEGIAIDLHRDGECLIGFRRERAKQLYKQSLIDG